jgi:hypothetical protein
MPTTNTEKVDKGAKNACTTPKPEVTHKSANARLWLPMLAAAAVRWPPPATSRLRAVGACRDLHNSAAQWWGMACSGSTWPREALPEQKKQALGVTRIRGR